MSIMTNTSVMKHDLFLIMLFTFIVTLFTFYGNKCYIVVNSYMRLLNLCFTVKYCDVHNCVM